MSYKKNQEYNENQEEYIYQRFTTTRLDGHKKSMEFITRCEDKNGNLHYENRMIPHVPIVEILPKERD